MRNTRATQLLFELSQPGRRGTRLPACDVPDAPLDDAAARPSALADVAAAAAGAGRARPGAALRQPVDAEHVDRHALLSARLVHDEVQPQAERAARRRCRAWPTCTPTSPTSTLQGMLRTAVRDAADAGRDRRARRRVAAAGRRRAGRADGAAGRGRLLPRPRRAAAPRCSPPTAPTAPIPPAPPSPASTPSPIKSTPRGFVDLDDLRAKLDDQHRRVHDHQSRTRWACSTGRSPRSPSWCTTAAA